MDHHAASEFPFIIDLFHFLIEKKDLLLRTANFQIDLSLFSLLSIINDLIESLDLLSITQKILLNLSHYDQFLDNPHNVGIVISQLQHHRGAIYF
jgi:hypothetical protein